MRCLNPAHHTARITKTDKDFAKKLDIKDKKVLVKVKDIHKIEKRILLTLVFLVMKTRKKFQSMYQKNVKKTCWFSIDWRRKQKTLCSH